MKTSVACCTYNGARFLHEQLSSIATQTMRPDEIVIVDDGSTDDTVRIATGFADGADAAIRIVIEVNNVNLGVVKNFEKALSMTTGDLIFLCDQDDVWHPRKVETMRREFDARPDLLLLFTDARLLDANGTPLRHSLFEALETSRQERHRVRDGQAFAALLVRNLVTGATTAMRRSVFEAARPFPAEWVHDEWLAIVASMLGVIDALDSPLIDYRQHGGNQIGIRRLNLREKLDKLLRSRADYYVGLQRRAEVLLERSGTLAAPRLDERTRAIREKLAHVRYRATLPRGRLQRLLPIAREITTGRYQRYSSGLESIVRDCVEPA